MMKKILFVACLALMLPTLMSAQLTNGLIAHWGFNGNTNDLSGNGNHGTPTNITYVAGKLGNNNTAAKFNGTSSVISVPYNSKMNLTKITMCAVVYFDDFYSGTCQHSMIFQRGSFFQPGSYSLSIYDNAYDNGNCSLFDSTKMVFHSKVANRESSNLIDSFQHTPTVSKRQWYCVVATCDGSRTRVYVDGVQKMSYKSNLAFGTSTEGMSIGANLFNQSNIFPYWLNGRIDDIRLYNRAFSPTDVMQYCNMFDTTVYISQAFTDTLFCTDDTVTLQYGVTDNFNSGNTFTAQLSDATGSFSSPTNIGSVSSTTAGSITCNIPGGLTPSSLYRVRIISSNPQRTSDVSRAITVHPTLGPPVVNTTVAPAGIVPPNTTLTFTANVTNAGSNPTYQWYRNGQPITNATGTSWSSNTLNDNDSVWVVVYSSNMCPEGLNSESNKVQVKIESSVRDIVLENFALYPNPNNGRFVLTATSVKYDAIKVDVLNSVGQIVYSDVAIPRNGKLGKEVVLKDVASGMYLLRMSVSDKQKNIRFIIK